MDRKTAAEWFVVAWCKNWTIGRYLRVVTETAGEPYFFSEDEVALARVAFPWLPSCLGEYIGRRLVRGVVEDNYNRLSTWLWSRPTDLARLACAPQVERLVHRGITGSAGRLAEIKKNAREHRRHQSAMLGARLRSERDKSHARSAWNVCKG